PTTTKFTQRDSVRCHSLHGTNHDPIVLFLYTVPVNIIGRSFGTYKPSVYLLPLSIEQYSHYCRNQYSQVTSHRSSGVLRPDGAALESSFTFFTELWRSSKVIHNCKPPPNERIAALVTGFPLCRRLPSVVVFGAIGFFKAVLCILPTVLVQQTYWTQAFFVNLITSREIGCCVISE
ncbi:hypothetical protein F1880_004544, partial [Penicillium rolfsii]